MVAQEHLTQEVSGFETWLRSPSRRFLLIVLATLLASVVTTFQLFEVFDEFAERRLQAFGHRPEFDWIAIWQHQLIAWGIWAIALEPILWISKRLNRVVGHWSLIALLHVPLSYGAAYGSVELSDWVSGILLDAPARPEQTREDGAENGRDGQPGRPGAGRRPRGGGPQGGRPRDRDAGRPPRGVGFFMRSRKFRMPRDMSIYWVILGLGVGVSSYLRSREQERAAAALNLNSANLETQLARAQMDSLKSQLQPHFLFNALHTVGGLIRAKEEAQAVKMLSALGGLLRKTLDLGESQRVSLGEELEIAELYLSIEKIRFGERLVIVVDAVDDALDLRVPALILLPLVENAVRYAVEPRVEGGRVEVEAVIADGKLRLEVSDDGSGFPEEVLRGEEPDDGRSHIGLANSRRRLEMLYGDEMEFTLANETGRGASVRISIPIERSGDHG